MIKKPANYDKVEVKEFDFVPLEVGGHKCIITNASEYTSDYSGKTSLKVEIDTDKTDKQPNYFKSQFDNDTRENKKWSNNSIKYVSLGDEENQVRMLKGFITAVENSNAGFKFDWNKDVSQLNNKKIGGVYALEEYRDSENNIKVATRLRDIRSFDKVDHVLVPKVRTIDNQYVDYDDYIEHKQELEEEKKDIFKEAGLDSIVEIDDNFLD